MVFGFETLPGDVVLDLVALAIVGFLAARQFRVKQLKVSRLWVFPALALLFTYTGIQGDLFDTRYSPAVIGVAFAIGLALGAVRGAATKLTVDAKAQIVIVQGTLLSVMLWIVTLAVKGVADFAVAATGAASSAVGLTAALATAALLALSLGAVIATRVYYYWRYALAVV